MFQSFNKWKIDLTSLQTVEFDDCLALLFAGAGLVAKSWHRNFSKRQRRTSMLCSSSSIATRTAKSVGITLLSLVYSRRWSVLRGIWHAEKLLRMLLAASCEEAG